MSIAYNPEAKIRNVLFVCADNARHSLIAEALLRGHGIRGLRAFSAGLQPADRADSFTLSALALVGLEIDGLWPKHWDGFADGNRMMFDRVVMIGDNVACKLPRSFPGNPDYVVWNFSGDNSLRFHHGVWRDIQTLRPNVDVLVDEFCYGTSPNVNIAQLAAPAE